ncbi:CYTH domain-containing protein [Desemzia incerta]|uniref:CYTH domain-containing protein n=1 Tax=Desemzia incerta TaxID=82801 RepID=UPI003CFF2A4A
MSEELEIEFKNLLSKSEYNELLNIFNAREKDFFSQENHYFDTADSRLRKLNSGLRIRLLPQSAELTLKTPLGLHLLETTDQMTLEEAHAYLAGSTIKKDGMVGRKLTEMNILIEDLRIIGSLKTVRFETSVPEGLVVLDKSTYAGKLDYELEFEAQDHHEGLAFFNQFLEKYAIPRRIGKNKIARMKEAMDENERNVKP